MFESFKSNRIAMLLAVTIVALLLSAMIYHYQTAGSKPPPSGPYFYSVDDGRSYFTSNALKFPPFTENGQEAVSAAVYAGQANQPFVGFLYKYSEEGQTMLASIKVDTPYVRAEAARFCLVKRPGEKVWVPVTSRKGAEITAKVLDPKTSQPAAALAPS